MRISWSQLKPKEFELLCCLILEANQFTDIQWFGESGGDKGRDIIARKMETPLSSFQKSSRWVVQCKRYISKPLQKADIASFLASAREHKPDKVLIAITNTLSSNTKDWLESIRHDYPFEIYLWEELDLLREIYRHKRQIAERLPQIFGQDEPVFIYYGKHNGIPFVCNEFEEIEIVIYNKDSIDEAREEVVEFIQFLKQNEVEFDWPKKKRNRA